MTEPGFWLEDHDKLKMYPSLSRLVCFLLKQSLNTFRYIQIHKKRLLPVGAPEFWHLTLLHERICESCRANGHDPPQVAATVIVLILFCFPLAPHWWEQGPHSDQELTWQARGLHGGLERLLLLRLHKDSASRTKTSNSNTTAENFTFHIIHCGIYQVDEIRYSLYFFQTVVLNDRKSSVHLNIYCGK